MHLSFITNQRHAFVATQIDSLIFDLVPTFGKTIKILGIANRFSLHLVELGDECILQMVYQQRLTVNTNGYTAS